MMLTYDDVTLSIEEWSERYGVPAATIGSRLKRGWTPKRAITWPTVEKLNPKAVAPKPEPKPTRAYTTASNTLLLEYNGEALSIPAWAKHLGVSASCIRRRLIAGWTIEQALTTTTATTKHRARHVGALIEFGGKRRHLSDWARISGINKQTLHYRLKAGWTIERALTEPLSQDQRWRLRGGYEVTLMYSLETGAPSSVKYRA